MSGIRRPAPDTQRDPRCVAVRGPRSSIRSYRDNAFRTKPEIALQLLRHALADGVPPAPVLMDPAYGNDSKLRAGISELGLTYVAGILPTTMVWRPST